MSGEMQETTQRIVKIRLEPDEKWAEKYRYVDAETGMTIKLIVYDKEMRLTETLLALNVGDRIDYVNLFLPGPDGKPYLPEGADVCPTELVTFEKAE